MRSPRVLALLLVLFVLVPAGILGWLGIRGTDRFAAEMRQRIEQELDVIGQSAKRLTTEFVTEEARDADARVASAADLLARRLPFERVGRMLASAKESLPSSRPTGLASDSEFDRLWDPAGVELRILDATSKQVLPVAFDPDGGARERSDSDRLFDDLAREAETAAFGRRDLPGAVELWTSAAKRFSEPSWRARAFVEAALLVATLEPAARRPVEIASVLEVAHTAPVLARVGRPWVLLLMRSQPPTSVAIARLRALDDEGRLAEVALTEQERTRIRKMLDAKDAGPVADAGGRDVRRAPLPGGLVLEVSRRWPSLETGPAGALYERLRARLSSVANVKRPESLGLPALPDGSKPANFTLDAPRPGGPPAWTTLTHRDEGRLLAEVANSRRWTIVGVLSLVGVIGLGLLVGRSALAREREARQLKDDFLANVSHELRTPLTSVCLHADLLAESGLADSQRLAHAEVVRAEGARLSALVDDLLDFAALERGSRRLEPEPVDLGAAAERALAPFRVLAAREGVALALDRRPGESLGLADPHALGRVLSNLVGNAWKHGRPSRDGSPGRIEIRVKIDGARALLDVMDDGPGIPASERALLFERFQRGSAAGKTRGVGLGLALSRDLARAMGGDVCVVGDPAYTRFRLTLPLVPSSETPS